jgi:hypothetical protein
MARSRLSRLPTISITSDGPHDALWNQIPDEHAARVGRLIAAWSLIEFKLECLIWHIIGGDKRDLHRLTSKLDWLPKEQTIDSLLAGRKVPAEHTAAWEAAENLMGQLSSHRNLLAHVVWVPFPIGQAGTGLLQTRKGGIIKDAQRNPTDVVIAKIAAVTTTQLDHWIQMAGTVVDHLNTLLNDEPPPSRDTP